MSFFLIALGGLILFALFSDGREARLEKETVASIIDGQMTNEEKLNSLADFFSQRGFFISSRTATQVQLIKKKQFSFWWAVIWLLVFGVGLLVYIFYYLSKRDEVKTFTLSVPPIAAKVQEPAKKKAKRKSK